MKRILSAVLTALVICACSSAPADNGESVKGDGTVSSICTEDPDYDTYFTGERLRIDLVFTGNREAQNCCLSELYRESEWAGSHASLINRFGYGQYCLEAFAGETLIFSTSFCTLFEEWTTTEQASRLSMAGNQTVWMPFPKQSVRIVLYERIRRTGRFEVMQEFEVDPSDRHIIPGSDKYAKSCLQKSGDPKHKVDLVFLAEGYTAAQMDKFRTDAARMTEYLFSMEPYASRRDDFNVTLVESVSEEEGTDIPQEGQWRNTVMDSSFDTFYIDRYLTIFNHRKIADALSGVGFDTIFIIANEDKYGGGGIYNSYALGTSDNSRSDPVFIHEFGHSFAGLADEYYESETAYEDYYPEGVEPWEDNITTQVDFGSKWADMMDVEGVGLFEGAGYVAKGCWRPYEECRMLNNTAPAFCPVCQRAISRMIDFYCR